MNDGNTIGFSASGLKAAMGSFEAIAGAAPSLGKIIEALDKINTCWTGTQHNLAQTDYTTATDNLEKAKTTLESMSGAVNQLAANASNVTYG